MVDSRMRITAFLGSPRANGNTDILASQVLEGARESGHITEAIALRRLTISPCIGCEKCWQNGQPCVLKDDMGDLYQTVADSQILVFATPVYWYAPTAIMKAFLDRLVPLNRPQGRPLIQNKGGVLVVVYEESGPEAAEPLIRMFEMSFDYLGLKFLDRIVVDGTGPKGAILQKPDALARAREIGRTLELPT
jgi:multimeric flavodoxin WrbA